MKTVFEAENFARIADILIGYLSCHYNDLAIYKDSSDFLYCSALDIQNMMLFNINIHVTCM